MVSFEEFKERFRSPIFGNFLISWLIVNWKIPYVTVFVKEESLKGKTKLDTVLDIINSYDCPSYRVFWLPLLSTLFIIFIYPILFNQLEKVRLYYERILLSIREKGEKELITLSDKYNSLNSDFIFLERETKKECDYYLYHFDKKLERLFLGKWAIEVCLETVNIYTYCEFKEGSSFINNDGFVLGLSKFEIIGNSYQQDGNYKLTVTFKNQDVREFNMYIRKRSFIEFNQVGHPSNKVRLIWTGI